MKIPKTVDLHFKTACALLQGISESIEVLEDAKTSAGNPEVPPEHSPESVMRRLIQARQELLVVEKSFQKRWTW